MLIAQHMAIAHRCATPTCALSHRSRICATLRCPGLAFAEKRADDVILEARCLAPRTGDWLQHSTVADLRIALHHVAGPPPNFQEHPKPQSATMRMLAAEGTWWLVAWLASAVMQCIRLRPRSSAA